MSAFDSSDISVDIIEKGCQQANGGLQKDRDRVDSYYLSFSIPPACEQLQESRPDERSKKLLRSKVSEVA